MDKICREREEQTQRSGQNYTIYEKFRWKGKRKRECSTSVPTFSMRSESNEKKFQRKTVINHECHSSPITRKKKPLQFFQWGWKRSFDVQCSNLMIRYIAEETDGDRCWITSNKSVPFVYIWYSKDGWFLLRQLFDVFLHPGMDKILYYKKLLLKARVSPEDELFGCMITRVTSNKNMSLWQQLESAGVNNPWCVCCNQHTNSENRCKYIDLINLQSTRKFVITQDAPCKKVLPLLETIVTLTKSNNRKRALTESDKQKILMAQRCMCGECGKHLNHIEGYEVHHIFKLSEGGSNSCVNLLAVCPTCHKILSERERNRPFTPVH